MWHVNNLIDLYCCTSNIFVCVQKELEIRHLTAVTKQDVFELQIRAEIYFLFSCREQREELSLFIYHVQFNVQLFVIKKKDIFNDFSGITI